jgi:hypothetical protein
LIVNRSMFFVGDKRVATDSDDGDFVWHKV